MRQHIWLLMFFSNLRPKENITKILVSIKCWSLQRITERRNSFPQKITEKYSLNLYSLSHVIIEPTIIMTDSEYKYSQLLAAI